MERFNGQALNLKDVRIVDAGDPLGYADINAPGATTTVHVRNVSGGGLATIYSDNSFTPKSNPFNTDAKGAFEFYAANGRYNVIIDEGEATEETIGDVLLYDAEESVVSTIRYSKLDNPLLHILKTNKLTETIAPNNQDSDLTWTRATTATYVDRYGVVQSAAVDTPREEKEGWLIEGASTNLCTNSDTTLAQITFKTTGITDDPTFDQFDNGISFASGNAQDESAYKSATTTGGNTYTFSCFVVMDDNGEPAPSVNASTGDFCLYLGGQIATGSVSVKLINKDENLYRVSGTNVSPAINSFCGVVKFTTQSGKGFKVTGYQLEELPFASSYIPTAAASVTRAADVVSFETKNNYVDVFNNEFGMFYSFKTLGNTGTFQRLVQGYADGGSNARFYSLINSANQFRNRNSSNQSFGSSNVSYSDFNNAAVSIDSNLNATAYIDNVSNSLVITPTDNIDTAANFYVGSVDGTTNPFYGYINDLRVYNFALNADEVNFLGE